MVTITKEDNIYNYNIKTKKFAKDVFIWFEKYENGSDSGPNLNKMKNRLKNEASDIQETEINQKDLNNSFDAEIKKEGLNEAFKSIPWEKIANNPNASIYWRSYFKIPLIGDLKAYHEKLSGAEN